MTRSTKALAAAFATMLLSGVSAHSALAASGPSCLKSANNQIKHVVYIQFDNTHLGRDNPNVPSDLEQMPHLLSFLQGNGVLMSNHHTGLIAHTATGILSSITGLYGDRMGVPISNSFVTYKPNSTALGFPASFAYWTDPVQDGSDPLPNMLGENGVTVGAPWVAYTRSSCDVGLVATANTVIENINTFATGDIAQIFGNPSAELTATGQNKTKATADYEGIAIHCTINSPLCNTPVAKTDKLPNEAGGYRGFRALFGHKYVAQQIGTIAGLDGSAIQDPKGDPGFPGFDGMSANVSLGYVAKMLEAGLPVVYAYISDVHDNHGGGGAYGPGEAGYVQALQSYDAAFANFFQRLAADGIDQTNTLFVFTADEGDHFAGTDHPTPAGCDGVNIPCTYVHSGAGINIGEITADLAGLVTLQTGDATPFDYHWDSVPTVLVKETAPGVIPGQTDANVRQLERDVGTLQVTNPLRGTQDTLTQRMIDHTAMRALHMLTSDPLRTPTFAMFANADYFFQAVSNNNGCAPISKCVFENSAFAWNHGDFQNEIAQTWLGMVGPGVNPVGRDDATWSDHVDIRPTILALTGIRDSYQHDGRVLVEALNPNALPASLSTAETAYLNLAVAYKRINAPFQDLGQATLKISTGALLSGNASDDSNYTNSETLISNMTDYRNSLAAQMRQLLNDAAFKNGSIDAGQAQSLVDQANALVAQAQSLAP